MNGSRYSDVPTPARTDGVGSALRRAFHATGSCDDEFSSLLRRLDDKGSR